MIHETPIGDLENVYDFSFDVDNHQDFFNLSFCTFSHFVNFLFDVQLLFFPLSRSLSTSPEGVFPCAAPNGGYKNDGQGTGNEIL